jgi:hypothetical protein
MKACWAQSLGNCSDKITKEHLVSATFFPGNSVSVIGFEWCKTNFKSIGLASLVQHSLCKHHNNALTDLDSTAGTAIRKLVSAVRLSTGRDALLVAKGERSRAFIPITFNVHEPLFLERWFLKTCLNLLVARGGSTTWRQTGNAVHTIPEHLVRMAFGEDSITRPFGLYAAVTVGERVAFHHGLVFKPLMYVGRQLVAGLFEFGGLRFVLHLEDQPLPDPLVFGTTDERWRTSDLLYHVKEIKWNVQASYSHTLKFHWT